MQTKIIITTLIFLISCGDNTSFSKKEKSELYNSNLESILVNSASNWPDINLNEDNTSSIRSANIKVTTPLPSSMGAIGDSMSRAALSTLTPNDAGKLLTYVKLFGIGISGIFRKSQAANVPGASWTTGEGIKIRKKTGSHKRKRYVTVLKKVVNSHKNKIESLSNTKIKYHNVAQSGNSSRHLKEQTERLNIWSKKTLKKPFPDYITVLIGGNDICSKESDHGDKMTDVDRFYDRIYESINQILTSSETSKILLVSVPNVEILKKTAENHRLPFLSKSFAKVLPKINKVSTCKEMWENVVSSLCANVMLDEREFVREIIKKRIIDYNTVLEEVAFTAQEKFGDRIRYSDKLYNYNFKTSELAMDCFHPNINGQNTISDLTWQDSWWADR